jgi:Tol biopolymer transport system component
VPLLRWPLLAAVAALVTGWIGFALLRAPEPLQAPPPLNRNVVSSIWSIPVAGGRPQLVSRARGWQDSFPTYRRDGSILFVRWTSSTTVELLMTNLEGRVQRLRSLPVFTQLVYSPATDEIALARGSTIVAESLAGDRRRVLAHLGSDRRVPVWSADGTSIAFSRQVRSRTGTYHPELVVIRSGRERVYPLPSGSPGPVAFSPHGDQLLFGWGLQLFLLDTHTGRRRLFANGNASHAAWSPDGHTIAYLDDDGLVTKDVRTNRRRVLVRRPNATYGAFSPDGRSLVYVTQKIH